jgi:hypothetical protein
MAHTTDGDGQDVAKEIVESALGLLLALTRSRQGAVFVCEAQPELLVSHRIDQAVLQRISTAWEYGRDALACGSRVEPPTGGILCPVLVERQLKAIIYLERIGDCSDHELGVVAQLIGNRLQPSPEYTPIEPDEREHLLLLLERNEWNIARVARVLGVSRLTVYRRLARLRLSRPDGHPTQLPHDD